MELPAVSNTEGKYNVNRIEQIEKNGTESRLFPSIDYSRYELECGILSSLMIGGFQYGVEIKAEWFSDDKYRQIFEMLDEMRNNGEPITSPPVLLANARKRGLSCEDLKALLNDRHNAAHLKYFATHLREQWAKVQVQAIAQQIAHRIEQKQDYQDLLLALNDFQVGSRRTLSIRSASQEIADSKGMRPPVVDGILRQGETMNVIAAPKLGKSWLVLGLALSIANGTKWLWWPAIQGRVLIIDNELHRETSIERLKKVAHELQLSTDNIDIYNARGEGIDIFQLRDEFQIGTGYSLIILDAFYRFIPHGVSENDNAGMMSLYNAVDTIAAETGAAVALIHHTSKGNQGQKGITDVGAGAGSISRAADTHLILRPHEIAGSAVLEAVTRSFVSPEPRSLVFDYPVWRTAQFEPEIKGAKQVSKREETDQETMERLLAIVRGANGKAVRVSAIRNRTGFGDSRTRRGIMLLEQSGEIKRCKVKSKTGGGKVDAIRGCTESCTESCTAN